MGWIWSDILHHWQNIKCRAVAFLTGYIGVLGKVYRNAFTPPQRMTENCSPQ